jgi:hypothetical protein
MASGGQSGQIPTTTRNNRIPHPRFIPKDSLNGRRSSATTRPPLPPNIGGRSHSLDGLLDDTTDSVDARNTRPRTRNTNNNNNNYTNFTSLAEGESSTDTLISNHSKNSSHHSGGATNGADKKNSKESIRSTTNRRSRSLDDLLDEDNTILRVDEPDRCVSMEELDETEMMSGQQQVHGNEINEAATEKPLKDIPFEEMTEEAKIIHNIILNKRIAPQRPPPPTSAVENEKLNSSNNNSPVPSEQLCENETITIENTMKIQPTDNKDDLPDEDNVSTATNSNSTYSRQESVSSLSPSALSTTDSQRESPDKTKKTFMNKYMKKVKLLMKK